MSQHRAEVVWSRQGAKFVDNHYSRVHEWRFDALRVRASAAPSVVPLPLSSPDAIDPEEAFVAAIASCHMLGFLSEAARAGYVVDQYRDEAVGTLARNRDGRLAIVRVVLVPSVAFVRDAPTSDEYRHLHDIAHWSCFITNSIHSEVVVDPEPLTVV